MKAKTHANWIHLCCIALLASTAGSMLSRATGTESLSEPWAANSREPGTVPKTHNPPTSRPGDTTRGDSLLSDYANTWLRFYQLYLSSTLTTKCPMTPSCSAYSILAIRKHGVVKGIVLTADRLIHEGDEQRFAKQVGLGDAARYLDPVENNDFWWDKK